MRRRPRRAEPVYTCVYLKHGVVESTGIGPGTVTRVDSNVTATVRGGLFWRSVLHSLMTVPVDRSPWIARIVLTLHSLCDRCSRLGQQERGFASIRVS